MRADALCVLVFTLWAATSVEAVWNWRNKDIKDDFIEASNKFSVALMKEVFKQPGNFIVSPLSVSTLLGMLQQGAKANSSLQLESVLHMKREKALSGFNTLLSHLKNRETRSVFSFGNAMFVNQDFDLLSGYREVVVRDFHATVEGADFRYPSTAAEKINKWVSNSTGGRIPDIVKAESISGRTEMVLANAMYFKGAWLNAFFANFSRDLPFYKAGNAKPITVSTMIKEIALRAGEETGTLNAKWIEMPYESYGGPEYSMIVVLPNDDLDAMMTRLTYAHLIYLAGEESIRDVSIKMPRFKIDTDLALVPTLQALGLQDVFNQNSHLEGISTTKAPLIVSDVLHKAKIEVNEDGSEAAAASAIVVNTLSLAPDYGKMDFVANKPFLAMIVDRASSLPLFVAKVVDPSHV